MSSPSAHRSFSVAVTTTSSATFFGQVPESAVRRTPTTYGGEAGDSVDARPRRQSESSSLISGVLRRTDSSSLIGGRRFWRRDTSGFLLDGKGPTMPGGAIGGSSGVGAGGLAGADDGPAEDTELAEGRRRRRSIGAEALATPQVRSMRLIGNSNPRYQWEKYFKTKKELAQMKKPLRQYYERNNYLISQYLYIDRLLDSSMPHELLQEYSQPQIPPTIAEEGNGAATTNGAGAHRIKRTPQNIYRVPSNEHTPLLPTRASDELDPEAAARARDLEAYANDSNDPVSSTSRIVTVAIGVNAAANAALLAAKIAVTLMSSSLSVLASLVDAALDFLSTAIVWATARLVARQDGVAYPVGRRPLEPLGVLVFAVIMMTAFTQVGVACLQALLAPAAERKLVRLDAASISIMVATVALKGACWAWCRRVRSSAVQALAQDAATDVAFNTFSLFFPLVGGAVGVWWLDPLGGLLLALLVIVLWAWTAAAHLRQLSGCAADRDTRALLLYLTLRFASCVQAITALRAWHAGDGVLVEVDIVLDPRLDQRDCHDVGESLQYVLESVPGVERAWVHLDYRAGNLSGHVARED